MRTLGIGIAAAITLAATMAPANAQGLWIGAPGFGVGIGVGPTPYYGGYRGAPIGALVMAMDTATSRPMPTRATPMSPSTATTPMLTCPMMATLPIRMDRALRTYAYDSVDSYGYAPRPRYSRNYAYSPEDRATRTYSYDTRDVRRDHRSTIVHNTRLQDRAVTRRGFAFGAERENADSRRIRPEASKALARGPAQDLRQSKRIEGAKTGNSRVRTQNY